MQLRNILGALCAAASFCVSAAIPPAEQTVAVEFYHAGLDHYFITAAGNEISDLDTGVHTGWTRTGYRFSVIKSGSTYPGTAPMCRFWSHTLSSHFYTAKASECEEVKVKFANAWQFESGEVFRAFLVDPSHRRVPGGHEPVYRLYNNRPDVNHRYTTQLSVFVFMKGKGHIPEGDGNPALPVAFCTPAGGDVVPAPSALAPACTVDRQQRHARAGLDDHAHGELHEQSDELPVERLHEHAEHVRARPSPRRVPRATRSTRPTRRVPPTPVTVSVNWTSGGGGAVPMCTLSANEYCSCRRPIRHVERDLQPGCDELRMDRNAPTTSRPPAIRCRAPRRPRPAWSPSSVYRATRATRSRA